MPFHFMFAHVFAKLYWLRFTFATRMIVFIFQFRELKIKWHLNKDRISFVFLMKRNENKNGGCIVLYIHLESFGDFCALIFSHHFFSINRTLLFSQSDGIKATMANQNQRKYWCTVLHLRCCNCKIKSEKKTSMMRYFNSFHIHLLYVISISWNNLLKTYNPTCNET